MRRAPRDLLRVVIVLAALVAGCGEARAFGLDDVARRAEALAAAPYQKPNTSLPRSLKSLTYDQYRDIRFRPERALWHGTRQPFEVMFFHRGALYEEPVTIHEIAPDGVREIPFDADAFDYGRNKIDRAEMTGVGYAGFRIHFPVNVPTYRDEVVVFLGASYFRAVGKGQRYGLSARGLAIDTAESSGEEFPRFVASWIDRPPRAAKILTIFALLDSPRAAGAYRFVLTPGVTTALDVDARLILRRPVAKLALAPLTSMFLFGSNQRSAGDA